MNDPNWWLDVVGVSKGTALAAFLGALFSFRLLDKTIPVASRLVMVACGFAASIYLTPAVVDWFSFKPSMTGAVGFALGLFSMSLIDALAAAIKSGQLLAAVKGRLGL